MTARAMTSAVITTSMAMILCAGNHALATERKDLTGTDPLILAHAGASLLAPENTLPALKEAKEIGADGFETDVRMTKDHQLVLHHDDSIGHESNGEGLISEMTLEELQTYDFGSWFSPEYEGEKILTLEECLEAAKELDFERINLELKPVIVNPDAGLEDVQADEGINGFAAKDSSQAEIDSGNGEDAGDGSCRNEHTYVERAADTILQSGIADRVIVTSFDSKILKEFKEYAPQIPVGIITIPDLSFLNMFNLAEFIPAEKPLEDYEAEDVKDVPGMISIFLKGFGAKGRTPQETMLEVVHSVAAAVPAGTSYLDLKTMLAQEADVAAFVESLDFQVDYVNCHYNSLTPELVTAMHDKSIGVMTWTPDETRDLEKTLGLSVEAIVTNQPEAAQELKAGNTQNRSQK